MRIWLLCFLLLNMGLPVCADDKKTQEQALKQLMEELYQATSEGKTERAHAIIQGLALPNHEAWFKKTYGDEVGARVSQEYARLLPMLQPELTKVLAKVVRDGQSEVKVKRYDNASSGGSGLQNDAFAAMKVPVPLFDMKFVKPGASLGQKFQSFVYVDGKFHLVGKMEAVKSM